MKKENTSIRTGIYIDKETLKICDEKISKTNAQSRSEFISDAITMYVAWLDSKDTSKILTPALESVIGARVADSERRITNMLFKLSVEVAVLTSITAAGTDISQTELDRLRAECVKEVRRLKGNFKFENAVDSYEGELWQE